MSNMKAIQNVHRAYPNQSFGELAPHILGMSGIRVNVRRQAWPRRFGRGASKRPTTYQRRSKQRRLGRQPAPQNTPSRKVLDSTRHSAKLPGHEHSHAVVNEDAEWDSIDSIDSIDNVDNIDNTDDEGAHRIGFTEIALAVACMSPIALALYVIPVLRVPVSFAGAMALPQNAIRGAAVMATLMWALSVFIPVSPVVACVCCARLVCGP